jgi:hypothetical protein
MSIEKEHFYKDILNEGDPLNNRFLIVLGDDQIFHWNYSNRTIAIDCNYELNDDYHHHLVEYIEFVQDKLKVNPLFFSLRRKRTPTY